MRGCVGCFIVLTATLHGLSPATAQANKEVLAEALFIEGRRLFEANEYAAAAEKLAASDQAAPSVGARISLGACLAQLGRTASAWSAYRSAANLAVRLGDQKRAEVAARRATELQKKLSHLILQVGSSARVENLSISVDGLAIPRAMWGQRFPVDPGAHQVEVTAPGHQPYGIEVEIQAGPASATVVVPQLEQVQKQPAPPAVPTAREAAAAPSKQEAAINRTDSGGAANTLRIVGKFQEHRVRKRARNDRDGFSRVGEGYRITIPRGFMGKIRVEYLRTERCRATPKSKLCQIVHLKVHDKKSGEIVVWKSFRGDGSHVKCRTASPDIWNMWCSGSSPSSAPRTRPAAD